MFENRMLRKLFGPKSEDVAGSWRRLNSEELQNLYSSPNITGVIKLRSMKWVGHVARMGAVRNVYKMLVGISDMMRPLGRPRCRWEDNIRVHHREILRERVYWIHLSQNSVHCRILVHTVMNLRVQ